MPYKLRGKCVVRSDTGDTVKCHSSRDAALAHLRALQANVSHKAMEDVLSDREFWAQLRADMMRAMVPIFVDMYTNGAMLAAQELETGDAFKAEGDERPPREIPPIVSDPADLGIDISAINNAAMRYIADYSDEWWQQFSRSTQDTLRNAIRTARQEGLQPRQVARIIEGSFGRNRAQTIAVTEMTRLMGAGAQEQYRQTGYTQWKWRTVRDPRVCPICDPRHGRVYPMDDQFRPAHPNCRCWPEPVAESVATATP